MGNVNWVILGFRPEKCTQFFLGPRTSDFRPDHRNPYIKGPKTLFFMVFQDFFEYIWPLAQPTIAERGAALVEKAKVSGRDQVGCQRSLPGDPKIMKKDPKSLKSRFDPKVKRPKMGLSITPCQVSKRPTLFCDIWPR